MIAKIDIIISEKLIFKMEERNLQEKYAETLTKIKYKIKQKIDKRE